MNAADLHLGVLLAYLLAAGFHLALAQTIFERTDRRRDRRAEKRLFGWSNLILALWHLLQLGEYAHVLELTDMSSTTVRLLLGGQLVAGLLVLAIFFHLLATFEHSFRRRPTSLRAAITGHLHRHDRAYVVASYALVAIAGAVYVADAAFASEILAGLRSAIGPTSAYLFGLSLLAMTFIMFPARAGQEHLVVPVVGRAVLLVSLGVSVGLVAVWHDAHPRRTHEALLPWLHLNSVGFAVFLGLVRYEFAFMDRFVRGAFRVLAWLVVVVVAYAAFNRTVFTDPDYGRAVTSVARISILVGAVALAPWVGHRAVVWVDRRLFERRIDLEAAVRRFSRRLASSADLSSLLEGASSDIADAVHAKRVSIGVGSAADDAVAGDLRLRLPLGSGDPPPGYLMLGERRNLYPYFDGERRYLRVVASLLGAAVTSLRRGQSGAVATVGVDPAPVVEARRPAAAVFPPARLDPDWMHQVLETATLASENDGELARRLLAHLHRLAAHLDPGAGRWTTLGSELGFARDLLALERMRRHNRMEVDVRVEGEIEDQEMPRGALLPLLQNAFDHGTRHLLREARIEVGAALVDEAVRVWVEDNGPGFGPGAPSWDSHEGGLSRLGACLREFDAHRAALETSDGQADGARVTIVLPRRRRAVQPARTV